MNNQKVREKDDPTRTIIAYTSVPSGLDVRHTLLELNMSPKNTENSDQFLFEEGDTVGYVGKGQWAVGGRASLPLMVPAPVMHVRAPPSRGARRRRRPRRALRHAPHATPRPTPRPTSISFGHT